ncbi:transposase [Algibacillus agarilyticus]|uniref:transposase n=1 Tax=Algibacillus agarilyticus TaxID=2234133 RepID=UPI000DCF9632|nr:transposase [Algibacillus agarilyticus]
MAKVYSTAFKLKCVKRVLEQGYKISETALYMDVGKRSLLTWLRLYKEGLLTESHPHLMDDAFDIKAQQLSANKKIAALEQEVKKLKYDNTRLKRQFLSLKKHVNQFE